MLITHSSIVYYDLIKHLLRFIRCVPTLESVAAKCPIKVLINALLTIC